MGISREALMLAQEVLRRAAQVIEGGWSSGAVARDGSGRPVALFKNSGDVRKGGINDAAVSFSVYGAICKVVHEIREPVDRLPLLWDVLYRLASASDTPAGGTNHVHPVIQFNEQPGRTKEEVLALLDLAAIECERVGDGPFPIPVTADPNALAAL
jgi:hypothetical protein